MVDLEWQANGTAPESYQQTKKEFHGTEISTIQNHLPPNTHSKATLGNSIISWTEDKPPA